MAIEACAIALEFSADRTAVAPQLLGDLRLVEPLRSERGEHIPLSRGELVVVHRGFPCLGGWVES